MDIDDIYFAAINGEKEELIRLLEADEININEMMDCGVNDGIHTKAPALFSILTTMHGSGRFNYEILEILVRYGVNLNGYVEVSNDAFTRRIPILCYAVRDWQSPDLIRYFMQRGAYPDARQIETYADGHTEEYPLLYFAIQFWNDCELLQILLHHGAQPNNYVVAYNYEQACRQTLPLLFYALIGQQNLAKCAWLFRYGADLNYPVNAGYGLVQQYKFRNYISMVYPRFSDMLYTAYNEGNRQRMQPIHVAREAFLIKPVKSAAPASKPKAEEKSSSHAHFEADELDPLRKLALDLIHYDRQNRQQYAEALRDSQLQTGLFSSGKKLKQAAIDLVEATNRSRALQVEHLNQLDRQLTGGSQPRWWNSFNGLTFRPRQLDDILVWIPFKRFTQGYKALRLLTNCTASDSATGEELRLLIKSGEMDPIYFTALDPNREYSIAELCLWKMDDATEISHTVSNTYSDSEIRANLESRRQSMDNHERLLNTISNRGSFTDDELFRLGEMRTSDYFDSQNTRDYLLSEYESKMRKSTTTHVEVHNQRLFYHHYQPVGVIAFDENESAVAIMIYNNPRQTEVYEADFSNDISGVEKRGPYGNRESLRIFAIRNLGIFPIKAPDVLGRKPAYLSAEEWHETLYHCYIVLDKKYLKERIQLMYEEAGEGKRSTIRSTRLF